MNADTSNASTRSPLNRKRLFAMIATAVLLAGGITLVSVSAANAKETARLCSVVVKAGASATKSMKASTDAADATLKAITAVELPNGAGTSTDYAARTGSADVIGKVTAGKTTLAKIKLPAECTRRDQAVAINTKLAKIKTATTALDASAKTVAADFAVFQTDETARIAAEVEAARVAAEVEAARVAEVERVAAEANRVAAESQSYSSDSGFSSGGTSSSGSGSGSSSGGSVHPSGPPNGGQVGPGGNPSGVCWTSNGMGGSKPC